MHTVKDELVGLEASPLYAYRIENDNLPVVGEGDCDANLMFVGEAPGKNEAKSGRPFCGAAGKILDELLSSIGIDRDLVYITNIVKDRPPENRDPTTEEIELYGTFLDRQIEIIQPKVIVPLGRYAMNYIMTKFDLEDKIEPISFAHGKEYGAKVFFEDIKIVPMYHPAATIYNRSLGDTLFEDFMTLKKFI